MENPFKEFLPENEVFENVIFLKPSYVPEKLISREKEMKTIYNNFKKPIQKLRPSHMLIHGPPGAGKTHAIKKVIEQFNEYCETKGLDWEAKYFDAVERTFYQLLVNMAKKFSPGFPEKGFAASTVRDKILDLMAENDKKYILIIDGVDKMNRPKHASNSPLCGVVTFITRAHEIADNYDENMHVTGVLIANEFGLKQRLTRESYATSSAFHPKNVYFKEYNQYELENIIEDRCNKAFKENVIEEDAIKLLSEEIYQSSYDIEFALEVLRCSGERLMELENKEKIDTDIITYSIEKVHLSDLYGMIQEMDTTKLLTLWSIIQSNENLPPSEKIEGGISSGKFYEIYERFCEFYNLKPKRQCHITQNVTVYLEMLGLVSTKLHGMGRGKGRTLLFYVGETEGLKEATQRALIERFCDTSSSGEVPVLNDSKIQQTMIT